MIIQGFFFFNWDPQNLEENAWPDPLLRILALSTGPGTRIREQGSRFGENHPCMALLTSHIHMSNAASNTFRSGLHIMHQRKHCRRGTTRYKYKLGSLPVCVPIQATKQMYCDRAALLPELFILGGKACLMHDHVVQHLLLIRQWRSGASLRPSFGADPTIHRSR